MEKFFEAVERFMHLPAECREALATIASYLGITGETLSRIRAQV